MIFHKKQIFCILFSLCIFAADTRRLKKYQRNKAYHNIERSAPLLRQANTDISIGTGTDVDNAASSIGTGTGTDAETGTAIGNVESPNPSDALVLINPTETDSTPRLFKGLFFQTLMGNRGAGGGQSSIPYIIVNVPNNITNINQNSLNNNTRPPIRTPPITTLPITTPITTVVIPPVTTPTAGTRRRVFSNQILSPQESQVYQQRGSKPKREEDYAQNFIRSPNNQMLPVYLPPEIQSLIPNRNVVRRRGGQRRRLQNKNKNVNPFAAFANSFRRIQYL